MSSPVEADALVAEDDPFLRRLAIADELLYNEAQNEVVLIKYLAPEEP